MQTQNKNSLDFLRKKLKNLNKKQTEDLISFNSNRCEEDCIKIYDTFTDFIKEWGIFDKEEKITQEMIQTNIIDENHVEKDIMDEMKNGKKLVFYVNWTIANGGLTEDLKKEIKIIKNFAKDKVLLTILGEDKFNVNDKRTWISGVSHYDKGKIID